jgi:hypothetical protein
MDLEACSNRKFGLGSVHERGVRFLRVGDCCEVRHQCARFIHNNRRQVPPSCVRYSVPILRSILSGGFGFRGHSSICEYFSCGSSRNLVLKKPQWPTGSMEPRHNSPPPAIKIYGPKRGSQTANILDGVILVDHRVHGVILVVDRQNLLAIESYLDKRLVSLWKPESVDLLVLPHEVSSFDPE